MKNNKFHRSVFFSAFKYSLIFGLNDETFALLSSLPQTSPAEEGGRVKFMFYVTALDQIYWVSGTLIGAAIGSFIPFSIKGIGFALTAMFVVLTVEKILQVRRVGVFIIPAISAVLGVMFLPSQFSLLAALAASLILILAIDSKKQRERK